MFAEGLGPLSVWVRGGSCGPLGGVPRIELEPHPSYQLLVVCVLHKGKPCDGWKVPLGPRDEIQVSFSSTTNAS